jgi:hypothetical protein
MVERVKEGVRGQIFGGRKARYSHTAAKVSMTDLDV